MSKKSTRTATEAKRQLADLEAVFKALAHANRRNILMVLLFRGGTMGAGEIADRFACRWPTTSRHLRVLEAAGLVTTEARGRERTYRLETARLVETAGGWLDYFRRDDGSAPGPGRTHSG